MVRATLHEAALQWRRTVETEVLGWYDLVDEEKHTGRVTVPITRQQQLLVRRGPGPATCGEAAVSARLRGHPRPGVAQSSATYVENSAAFVGILRTTRPVDLVEELAEEPVAMDRRKATGGAANLHAGGWSDRTCSVHGCGLGGLDDSDGWWCAVGASLDQAGGAVGGRVGGREWVGSPARHFFLVPWWSVWERPQMRVNWFHPSGKSSKNSFILDKFITRFTRKKKCLLILLLFAGLMEIP